MRTLQRMAEDSSEEGESDESEEESDDDEGAAAGGSQRAPQFDCECYSMLTLVRLEHQAQSSGLQGCVSCRTVLVLCLGPLNLHQSVQTEVFYACHDHSWAMQRHSTCRRRRTSSALRTPFLLMVTIRSELSMLACAGVGSAAARHVQAQTHQFSDMDDDSDEDESDEEEGESEDDDEPAGERSASCSVSDASTRAATISSRHGGRFRRTLTLGHSADTAAGAGSALAT